MRYIFIIPVLALAACATPREQCIQNATQDLRVLDTLIEQTELNIERGYGVETRLETNYRFEYCASPARGYRFCNRPVLERVEHPIALNLDEERQKLHPMQQSRRTLEERSRTAIATCNTSYPEG
ncbi:hypothetical protein [Cochlodiniinecator piscidefendens]|uniref:hypothetical protein n=1 Tax=Cochlodiniinecator piscidefendens TaxID=2715756 RepID=UPI00140CFD28|nr:hypothetical protein [Cochlodiniinecator piscidefendens]